MQQVTPLVLVLIVINVALFLVNGITTFEMGQWFALYYPDNPQYGIWQFVTSMFMHGSLPHLLFNMFGLYMFGSALEKVWGQQKFLIFYFAAGIGAGVIYTLVNYLQFTASFDSLLALGLANFEINEILQTGSYKAQYPGLEKEMLVDFYRTYHAPMVGASGAIYGVLVAYAIRYPNAKLFLLFIPFPIAAKFFVPALLLLDLFSGVTGFSLFGGGIAHFAHLGGALVGFLLVFYWRNVRTN
jgi:membrane associated rhomboid family serine protease